MTYSAEISRVNPTCFLFLIDQSGSMGDGWSGDKNRKKADELALIINRLLQNLVIKCAKADGIRDYFYVGVLGYGKTVGPAFSGSLRGRELVPIGEIAKNPARLEERAKKVDDGAGGIINQKVKFPIWFDPIADNGTPMTEAFTHAERILKQWLSKFPNCFPPIVINITDGEPNSNPTNNAARVQSLASSDGNILIFNIHISDKKANPVMFPASDKELIDNYAKTLFTMSSELPPHILDAAQKQGYNITGSNRGFVFNADMTHVIDFLDIGTRPSNLR
jgi:hypothetical protein